MLHITENSIEVPFQGNPDGPPNAFQIATLLRIAAVEHYVESEEAKLIESRIGTHRFSSLYRCLNVEGPCGIGKSRTIGYLEGNVLTPINLRFLRQDEDSVRRFCDQTSALAQAKGYAPFDYVFVGDEASNLSPATKELIAYLIPAKLLIFIS